jgi:ribosome-associated protein
MKEFTLEAPHDYIQLNQLLKILNLVETGGEANQCITEGLVKVNGLTELQKRKKLRAGDKIEFEGQSILIAT